MKRLVLPILGIALGSLAITSSANGQGFELAQKYSDLAAGPKVIISRPDMIHDAILTYRIHEPLIRNEIIRVLSKPDMIAKGVSLYSLNPRIGTASFKFLSVDSFEVNVTGNYLYLQSTQPTDLGSWADPAAEVHFDVRVRGSLRLPTKTSPKLEVTNATISVPYIRIEGRNVAGGVVIAFAAINDFFLKHITGRSLIQGTFDRYLRANFTNEINSELGPINKKIAELAKSGFDPSYSLHGQVLRITMTGSLFKGPGGVTSKASDAANGLNSKVDPNAGHTLGKRKKTTNSAPLPGRETSQTRPRPRAPSGSVLTSDSPPLSINSDVAKIGTSVEGRTLEKRPKPSSSTGMTSAALKLHNAQQAVENRTLGKRKKPATSTAPNVLTSDVSTPKTDAASIQNRTLGKRKKPAATTGPILMDPR